MSDTTPQHKQPATDTSNNVEGQTAPFEYDFHVRYSEVDHRGLMTLPAVVNAFQDCSTFQSEVLGVGMRWLKQERHAWVLTHWHIAIDRYPALCEHITVGTFASRFRGVTAERFFYLRDDEGNFVAKGKSSWVFLNMETGKPARIEPRFVEPYGTHEPLPMPPESRRVVIPESREFRDPLTIRRGQIDTNEHVNNAEYVQMALEQLDREIYPHVLRVDYRRAAVLGDLVRPGIGLNKEGNLVITLDDTNDTMFASIELI